MLSFNNNLFTWRGPFSQRHLSREAGFAWAKLRWVTPDPYVAYQLFDQADATARAALEGIHERVRASACTEPCIPSGTGLYGYQDAGVEYITERLSDGAPYHLLADAPGLGKSAQALAVAKRMGLERLLVVCPASLRLNWLREIATWHGRPAVAVLTGKDPVPAGGSVVISYALLKHALKRKYDFVIIDEVHNIKSPAAKRTKLVLGRVLTGATPGIFLTGTPVPNGRPNELWTVINRCAPGIINHRSLTQFMDRFCVLEETEYGPLIKGAKRQRELYARLRGSGFMTRRLKAAVLTQLPPKRYKFVTLSPTGQFKGIIERERDFDPEEILRRGVPAGSGLPELRRAMGEAKVPHCVEYIQTLLNSGVEKVVVFGHHVKVMRDIGLALKEYEPAMILGGTAPARRQAEVDRFQTDSGCRVFIGNEAAEEGITLTAAQDLVMVEPEWVPGKNEQRADRLHRIGQRGSVLVHYVVVERSLDAKILAKAAEKATDINLMLDKAIQ